MGLVGLFVSPFRDRGDVTSSGEEEPEEDGDVTQLLFASSVWSCDVLLSVTSLFERCKMLFFGVVVELSVPLSPFMVKRYLKVLMRTIPRQH